MAKYLDSNGLSHFMGILKGLLHKHTVTITPTTDTITPVTSKTVVTSCTKKTVVTSHTAMSAVPDGTHPATLVITKDSSSTGDSVTVGTGASVTTGTAKTVVTGISSATTGSAHIIDNS